MMLLLWLLVGGVIVVGLGVGMRIGSSAKEGGGTLIAVGCGVLMLGLWIWTRPQDKPWPTVPARAQASQDRVKAAWPGIKAAFPGLVRYADDWEFAPGWDWGCFYVAENGEMAGDGDALTVKVAEKDLPYQYRFATGHTCHFCLHADGKAVDLSKDVCQALFLDREDLNGGSGDNLVVPLP